MNGGPKTLHEWIAFTHRAAVAHKADPNDQEAADAIDLGLAHIQSLQRAGTVADEEEAAAGETPFDPLGAAAIGAIQGGTLGLAGRISPTFRRALAGAREREAGATAGGDIGGSLALPGGMFKRGAFALKNPVASLALRGAGTGATIGGVRGANEADFGARGSGAVQGALIGAALGMLPAATKSLGAVGKAGGRRIDLLFAGPHPAAAQASTETAGTALEQAVAKRLGVSVEQVRGKVNVPGTGLPPKRPTPPLSASEREAIEGRRTAAKAATIPGPEVLGNKVARAMAEHGVDRPSQLPRSVRAQLPGFTASGNPQPSLAALHQRSLAQFRSTTPAVTKKTKLSPTAIRIGVSLARKLGQPEAETARNLAARGVSPAAVRKALAR